MKSLSVSRTSAFILVLGLALLVANPGFADSEDKLRKQAEQFAKILDKQAQRDKSGVATKDRQKAKEWVENVEVLLANGEEAQAKRMLKRVEFAVTMMDSMITAEEIERLADKQEEAYYQAKEEQIPELEKELESLKDEQKKLQQELEQLQQ